MLRDMPEVGKEILEATDRWFDIIKDDVDTVLIVLVLAMY